jgi:hypothetical protein
MINCLYNLCFNFARSLRSKLKTLAKNQSHKPGIDIYNPEPSISPSHDKTDVVLIK